MKLNLQGKTTLVKLLPFLFLLSPAITPTLLSSTYALLCFTLPPIGLIREFWVDLPILRLPLKHNFHVLVPAYREKVIHPIVYIPSLRVE